MIGRPRLRTIESTTIVSVLEGDYVKLDNGVCTFWCVIADVKSRGYFDGIVTSHLLEGRRFSYEFGGLIRFHERHILESAKNR